MDLKKEVAAHVGFMSLRQCLNAAMKTQTLLDEAAQDRSDFVARAGGTIGTDNGTYVAYLLREESAKLVAVALRDAMVARFGKEGTS